MKKILLATILLLIPCVASSAVHYASSCHYADVSTKVAAATAGDTIMIPAAPADPGYCDWGTNRLATTKSLKWIGAGTTQTIIKGKGVNYSGLMAVTARSTFEMSGIQWISSLTTSINGNAVMTINTAESGWRIHDCIFTYDQQGTTNGFGYIAITGQTYYGLVDRNIFNLVQITYIVTNINQAQTAWQADAQWGTGNANFIEHNKFYGGYAGAQYPELVQSNSGARMTIRYNDFYNAAIQAHSACEPTVRGMRSYETYNNYFHNTHTNYNAYMRVRAGSFVSTRNKVAGTWFATFPGKITIDNRRSSFESYCTGWGGRCDGNSAYDGNSENPAHGDTVDGWACMDQIGRGKQTGVMGSGGTQASDPAYTWGNVTGQICLSGTAKFGECDTEGGISACTAGGGTCSATTLYPNQVHNTSTANNSTYHLVKDRDYYEGVEKDGWTPYTCPHPLADPGEEGACTTDAYGNTGYSLTGGVSDTTPPTVTSFYVYSGTTVINFSELITATSGAAFTVAGLDSAMTLTCPAVETAASSITCTNSRPVYQAEGNGSYGFTGDKVVDVADNALATIDSSPTAVNLSTEVEDPPAVTLTVNKTGTGCTITSSPSGIICGSTCTADYDSDTVVTLGGYLEDGWAKITYGTGCADGTVTMDGAQSCTITCTEKKVLNWYLQ